MRDKRDIALSVGLIIFTAITIAGILGYIPPSPKQWAVAGFVFFAVIVPLLIAGGMAAIVIRAIKR